MKTFRLEILTPERKFLDADVEFVTVEACDGRLTVLGGHAPMVAPLSDGVLTVRIDGEEKEAFHSMGFLEVRPDAVLLFSQACEWPEEIDESRARAAYEKATEELRQRQSILEHRHSELSLSRAIERLRLKRR
ncbi:MAG: ATP synthase F1 subunit epsilon [Clostridia bacterium]